MENIYSRTYHRGTAPRTLSWYKSRREPSHITTRCTDDLVARPAPRDHRWSTHLSIASKLEPFPHHPRNHVASADTRYSTSGSGFDIPPAFSTRDRHAAGPFPLPRFAISRVLFLHWRHVRQSGRGEVDVSEYEMVRKQDGGHMKGLVGGAVKGNRGPYSAAASCCIQCCAARRYRINGPIT